MKPDIRRLTRPIIAGIGIGVILVAVVWLNRPLRLTHADPLQPPPSARAEPGGSSPAANPKPGSPEVNPAAFRDQGDLAFVWQ